MCADSGSGTCSAVRDSPGLRDEFVVIVGSGMGAAESAGSHPGCGAGKARTAGQVPGCGAGTAGPGGRCPWFLRDSLRLRALRSLVCGPELRCGITRVCRPTPLVAPGEGRISLGFRAVSVNATGCGAEYAPGRGPQVFSGSVKTAAQSGCDPGFLCGSARDWGRCVRLVMTEIRGIAVRESCESSPRSRCGTAHARCDSG